MEIPWGHGANVAYLGGPRVVEEDGRHPGDRREELGITQPQALVPRGEAGLCPLEGRQAGAHRDLQAPPDHVAGPADLLREGRARGRAKEVVDAARVQTHMQEVVLYLRVT